MLCNNDYEATKFGTEVSCYKWVDDNNYIFIRIYFHNQANFR